MPCPSRVNFTFYKFALALRSIILSMKGIKRDKTLHKISIKHRYSQKCIHFYNKQ